MSTTQEIWDSEWLDLSPTKIGDAAFPSPYSSVLKLDDLPNPKILSTFLYSANLDCFQSPGTYTRSNRLIDSETSNHSSASKGCSDFDSSLINTPSPCKDLFSSLTIVDALVSPCSPRFVLSPFAPKTNQDAVVLFDDSFSLPLDWSSFDPGISPIVRGASSATLSPIQRTSPGVMSTTHPSENVSFIEKLKSTLPSPSVSCSYSLDLSAPALGSPYKPSVTGRTLFPGSETRVIRDLPRSPFRHPRNDPNVFQTPYKSLRNLLSPLSPLSPLTPSPSPHNPRKTRKKRTFSESPAFVPVKKTRLSVIHSSQPIRIAEEIEASPPWRSDVNEAPRLHILTNRTFPNSLPISTEFRLFYRRFPISSYTQPLESAPSCSISNKMPYPGGTYNPPRGAFDLYTPRFVRGRGAEKVGLCPICIEPISRGGEGKKLWLAMKFSAFKCYHMQYAHGISAATGRPYSPPTNFRVVDRPNPGKNEKTMIKQGKCHKCAKWVAVEGIKDMECKVKELYWWKHAAACHQDSTIEGECDLYEDDDVYQLVLLGLS